MRNISLIIGREFRERVYKKSFIITTILMPLFVILIGAAPTLIMEFVDGETKKISVVDNLTDDILSMAGGIGTSRGTGGMATKLRAASMVCAADIPMLIVNGENPDILYDIFDGKELGTYFRWGKEA